MRKKRWWMAAGSAAGIVALLYLLRWPLLGWIVRGELEGLAREVFDAEVEFEGLGGGLFSSLRAEGVSLKPKPGSWFRSFTIRGLEVSYGLFGSGELEVRLAGARLALAGSDDPDPPHEAAPKVLQALQGFRFPGRLRVADSTVYLPDGSEIRILDGELAGGEYRLRIRREPFGETRIEASFLEGGAFRANAEAAEGDVPRIRVEGAARSEGGQTLTAQAEFQGRRIAFEGRAILREQTRVAAVEGAASLPEGSASLRLDLETGMARVDFDGTLPIRDPFEADLSIQGSGEGPVAGPLEAWRIGEARISAAGLRWRGLEVDFAKAQVAGGTPESLSFRATARRGSDRVTASGTVRLRPLEIDSELQAAFESAAPYLELLETRPPVEASHVEVAGRLSVGDAGLRFDGRVAASEGSALGNPWKALRAEGTADGRAIEVRELTLQGTPFAPEIFAFGAARMVEGVWEIERAQIVAGDDDIEARGVATADRVLFFFDAHGRFSWLAGLGIQAPPAILPISIFGEIEASAEAASLQAWFRLADGAPSPLGASGTRRGSAWKVAVQPTAVDAMGLRVRLPAGMEFEVGEGFLELIRLEVSTDRPDVSASIRGRLKWREGEVDLEGRAEPRVGGAALPALHARVAIREAVSLEVAWGDPGGDHLILRGSLGDRVDLAGTASLSDLGVEWIGAILGKIPLRGGVGIRCSLSGTRDAPTGAGEIELRDVAWGSLPGSTLTIPFQIGGDAVDFPEATHRTPFGPVSLAARVARGELRAAAEVRIVDPSVLLADIPAETRPWIPLAGALVRFELADSRVRVNVTAAEGGLALPDPAGELRDVSISAELINGGFRIDSVRGLLGGGPFHAEGNWRVFDRGRPLSLSVTGRELLVGSRKDVRIRASPRVDVAWVEGEGMWIRGDVEIPLLLYFTEFPTGGGNRGPKKLTAPGVRLLPAEGGGSRIPGIAGLNRVFLDLKVKSSGEIRVENSILGALLEAEGRIGGTAAAPSAAGTVTAKRGQIRLATGVFVNVVKGRIEIPAVVGQEPTVHFEGAVGRGEGRISIVVTGPLASPFLSLDSDPPRKQEELLAMIAFGAGPGEFQGDRAVGAVVRKLFEQFTDDWPSADAERVSKRGLSVGLVDSGASRPTVPWDLPSAGSSGGPMVRTEYILTHHVSVVAESDLEANWSGELKLRLRFR
jgi:hypothetical protein